MATLLNNTRRLTILLFFIGIIAPSINAQTQSFQFPDTVVLSTKFQNAIKKQTEEYYRLLYRDSTVTNHYSSSYILEKIDKDSNYYYLFVAEYWIAFHYKEMIPALIERITCKKEIGLVNYADLKIPERIASGQMETVDHGAYSMDDLFTIAGRANRLLTEITGEDFGHVSMYSTQEQLMVLQKKWVAWLNYQIK